MGKFRADLNEWLTKAVIVAMVFVSLVTPAQAAGSRPNGTLAPDPSGTSTLAFSVSQLAAAPTQEWPERHGTDTAASLASSPRLLSLIDLDTVRPIVVATEEGVYYTTNLDASSPTWQSLNSGFTTDEDRFVESVWLELYAYPDWWTGSIWAGTRSGIWLLSNAFGEGAWEQRMSREEFWALVTAQTGYVFAEDSFRVVAIEGSLDNYGTVYAVVRGRKDGSNPANDNCVWVVHVLPKPFPCRCAALGWKDALRRLSIHRRVAAHRQVARWRAILCSCVYSGVWLRQEYRRHGHSLRVPLVG
jgi:hypothetical protein